MKKNAIRILSLLLVVMTLVGAISLPVSAYSYPMNYTITYKTSDGKVLDSKSGTVDAAADTRNALRITSPSFDGYVLKNDSDAVVTGSMISWSFPASNYVRHGSGSYTVYYETLYAVWQYNPETYTIRYDANGGTGAPASQTKTYGVPLTLSEVKPMRAGYEFLGWSTDPATMLTNYAPGER